MRGLDMALEEGLNVKLVLIPDKEDPDSYVKKVGAEAFREFIAQNKKDFILFQIETSLKDAGSDATRKAEMVNQVAETISKIEKIEDFTRQQDYIRKSAQLLQVDEAGFTTLVNKFIRNRISIQENKVPFDEAQVHAENAQRATENDFSDQTFSLLFRDELHELEIARVLLVHGSKKREDNGMLIAEHILSELPEEDLIDNQKVLRFIHTYRHALSNNEKPDQSYFIYHPDPEICTLAVSLLNFPYQESEHWKRELSQSTGFQKKLFQQDYTDFIRALKPENEKELHSFLNIGKDTTHEEVDSAINYLKLRKVKRLLLQNQADMEKAPPADQQTLFLTHVHLKQLEIDLTRKMGSVVIK
jgi:DNA primase